MKVCNFLIFSDLDAKSMITRFASASNPFIQRVFRTINNYPEGGKK